MALFTFFFSLSVFCPHCWSRSKEYSVIVLKSFIFSQKIYDLKSVELTKKENNVKFYGYVKQRDFSSYIQLAAVLLASDSLFQSLI